MIHTEEDVLLSNETGSSVDSPFFIIDSGAMVHMCHDQSYISTYQEFDSPHCVCIADNGYLDAVGVGDINIQTYHNGQKRSSFIKGVLYLPRLCTSLLSMAKLADVGVGIISTSEHADLVKLKTREFMDCAS